MELGFAFLANAGEIGPDGRFFALGGGIDGISVPSLPITIPALFVLIQLKFRPEECDIPYRFRMTETLPDGDSGRMESVTEFTPARGVVLTKTFIYQYLSVSIFGYHLTQEGEYRLNFLVNDNPIGELRFSVARVLDGGMGGT